MIIDFRQADTSLSLEADLCIIGAGAAGITIAREFLHSNLKVYLLESGGLDFTPETQALYAGDNVGHGYYALDSSRLRYFGGTTNHWEGYCAPLAPIDFETRPWVPYSGWPISKVDLDPFYRRAQPICQLGDYIYGNEVWAQVNAQPHDFASTEVALCFWQFSPPTRFGEVYRLELERSSNVVLLLHANATNIEASETAVTVRHVDVRTLDGKAGRLRARAYVLACGGIENARLLLLSNGIEPGGLGNRYDLVGRFFMEHLVTEPGLILTDDRKRLPDLYRKYNHGGIPFEPSFCAGRAMQERERVLNSHAFIRKVVDFTSGIRAARELWSEINRSGGVSDDLADKIWLLMRDFDDVARFAYGLITSGKTSAYKLVEVEKLGFSLRSEQAPNPQSRVTLAKERDELGLRRVQLDWQLTELDKRTVRALTETLGAEFARLNIGRVRIADWLLDSDQGWPADMNGGCHHIGTTRMASDPRQGVVDADCRVHHNDNLYIAGSSVFPTGGCANPTLTIVALATRLADHLKAQLV